MIEEKWLYQKTKTGSINQWRAWNEENKIFTQYGQIGGKLQTTVGKECIATNVGRSNFRDPISQAIFEVKAMYKNQIRLKYSESIDEAQKIRIQPMLANDGKKIQFDFPVDIQRKYDGLRCMTVWEDGKIKLLSRGNKFYSVKHIEDELEKILPLNTMADGELYVHGNSLQRINSLVKRDQLESLKIEYHIYDIPGKGNWVKRKQILNNINNQDNKSIKIVETFTVNSIEEIIIFHIKFIQEGYEGAIIRLHNGYYEFGKRSKSLLKWKEFEDKEFKIIDIDSGRGKMEECPIFMCQNDLNDRLFAVVPIGTMEERKKMFCRSNIGKILTVKFIGRTEDNIPKFAVGKNIRLSEDIP